MEARFEGENGVIGRARRHVEHRRPHVFIGWRHVHPTTLLLRVRDQSHLEGGLDGASPAHGAHDSGHATRGHIMERFVDDLLELHGWVDADAGTGGQHFPHHFRLGCFKQGWMVVAHADAGDARENIQKRVAVDVSDVVADRLVHVNWEVLLFVARGLTILFDACHGGRAREGCLHGWSVWLGGEAKSSGGEALIPRQVEEL